jgi:TonB family protein
MMASPASAQSTSAAASPSITTLPGASASAPGDRAKRDADVFHWILIHSDKPRKPNQTRDERLSAAAAAAAAARAKPTPNTAIKADEAPLEVPAPAKTQMIATLDPTAIPAVIAADPAIERTTDKVTVRPALPQPIAPVGRSPLIEQAPVGPVEPATSMAITERNVVLSKVEVEPPAVDRPEPAPALDTTPAAVAPVPAPISSPTSAPATDETADEPGAESLKPLTRADPQFSAAMMRTLRKGKVEVQFTVQPDGSVSEPSVVTTSNAKLNAVALAAIAKWRFAPISKPQLGVVDMVFDIDAE